MRVGAGQPAEALDGPAKWLEDLDRPERATPQGATLAYWVGAAAAAEARSDALGAAAEKRLLRQAKDLLAESSRIVTEVRPDARRAWAEVNEALGVDATRPKDFDEAYQAGKEALAALGAARLSAGGGPIDEHRAAARSAFGAALELADRRTDAAKLNEARYLMAWVLWEDGDDLESAKLAAGVATKSPDDPIAESAAQLALAALQRIARQPDDADLAEKASQRLEQLAGFAADRWPEGDAADAAQQVLLRRALDAGDLDAAERVLDGVSGDRRPPLALHFALARHERAVADKSDAGETIAALQKAYDDAKRSKTPRLLSTATLYLAQAALDVRNARDAIELLEADGHGAIAALKSADANPALGQRAVVAYARAVAVANAGRRVDRALGAIDAVAGELDSDARRRLLLTIASNLRGDLKAARARGQQATGAGLRVAMAVLDRIDALGAGGDWNSTLWMAQTRLELGEAAGESPAAREQLEAASAAFASLVERSEADPGFAPTPTSPLAARLQLAQCDRRLGKRREALDAFRALLAERPAMLDVQVAAAETLQEWGVESQSRDRIEASIAGDFPDASGKNAVWGWAKIAAVAARASAPTRSSRRRSSRRG